MLTQAEALERLKKVGITDSIQVLRRWVRDGKIKAEKSLNKKEGYRIDLADLERFIEERNPLYKEVKQLRDEVYLLKSKIDELKKEVAKGGEVNEEKTKESEDEESEPRSPTKGAKRSSTKNGELNRDQVFDIFVRETKNVRDSELLGAASEELFGILFPQSLFPQFESETTELKLGSRFVCPGTGKKFVTAEGAARSYVNFLIRKHGGKKNASAS